MDTIFASQTFDRKGRHAMRIPNHCNNGHRSFDLNLMKNGAVQGGGGGAAGVLFSPSWTDPYSILYSNVGDRGYHVQPPAPPPLLPLPLPLSKSYNSNIKSLSYPPTNNSKAGRKNSKSKTNLKKDQNNNSSKPAAAPRNDPAELPRNGLKGNLNSGKQEITVSDVEFSGPSIYILAPPPSSLPLPSFAIRSKLGCKTEAAAASIISCTNEGLPRIQSLP